MKKPEKKKKKLQSKLGRPKESAARDGYVEILNAYRKLIYEIGPDQVTLEKVAATAGLTLGAVRYHFANSEKKLYMAALEQHLDKVYRMIDQRFSDERMKQKKQFNPLACYIDISFDWITDPVDSCFELYFYLLSGTKDRYPETQHNLYEIARTRIGSFLREAIGWKWIEPVDDIDGLAYRIHAIIMGFAVTAMTERTSNSISRNRALCKEMIFKNLLKK